jgi:hypothetical protein
MPKYVCSNNPAHQTDTMTADGICPQKECYGVGFLAAASPNVSLEASGFKEIGLCILLMDCSYSMKEPAFPGSPAKKDQLVAGSASGGVFDLKGMSRPQDAYVATIMFDSSPRMVFTRSVDQILGDYSSASDFAQFLAGQFTYQGTDINSALAFAKKVYDDFVQKGDLSAYGGPKNVRPVKHTVLKPDGDDIVVPNVRVLVYTDGDDRVTGYITGNPFQSEPVDVLMGAYFGAGEEPGCRQLKSILSKCPIHEIDQFFLINDPARIQTLRRLFRMSTGTSGFCPACLVELR